MKIRKRSLLVCVVGLAVSSCASKAGTGALVGTGAGAAVGAGIGAAVGGKEGALIGAGAGAVVGGITGASIGAYMDRQEKELRKRVKSASIERKGDNLIVRFESGILFDTNKADLRDASVKGLSDFSEVLKEFPDTNLSVEGHTDNTGTREINKPLSENRAKSVSSFLLGRGVAQSRLTSLGFADERPIATNSTPEGRQQNRRVEVNIVPTRALREKLSKG